MNYKDLPILLHNNIRLRPISELDTDSVVRWRNSDFVRSNFLYRGEISSEIHKQWLETKVFAGKVIQYIIEIENDTNFFSVGSIYYRDIDYENSCAEFGIFIGEDSARGKGIGVVATKLFLDFGHNQLNLHRIFLRLLAENIPAYKTYRKAGFITEGIFRDMKKIDGKYRDIMFMSSICNER